MPGFSFETIIPRVIAVLFLLPVHECAHAFAASLLGDNTAKYNGRMTLNPLKHLDLMGTLCLVVAGFGWAKPVPINVYNFKNKKYGMALSALAGPLSNFLVSFVLLAIVRLMSFLPPSDFLLGIVSLLITIAQISIILGVFNLIPAPPLDGSRIFLIFLPEKYYFKIMQYEQYIAIAVMVLVVIGVFDAPLSWAANFIYNGIISILF